MTGVRYGIKSMVRRALFRRPGNREFGTLYFRCNICGSACEAKTAALLREGQSCRACSSTVRMRAVVHLLSMELFGRSLAIEDFPSRDDITGIGMSDRDEYAVPLRKRLRYTNTFYHKEPSFDITSVSSAMHGTLDFLISSDVFEHVAPPVSAAFENARRLLKPGGVFILTAPYLKEGTSTKEHYPDLYRYEVVKQGAGYLLKNRTRDGREEAFKDPVFHGGPGSTLEMRLFTEASLTGELKKAGFRRIKIWKEPCFEHGVYWAADVSLPISARAE